MSLPRAGEIIACLSTASALEAHTMLKVVLRGKVIYYTTASAVNRATERGDA